MNDVMNTLMGHMITGRGGMQVMGTSIKGRDSVIVRLDLTNTPWKEGWCPPATFPSFLHTNGAIVICTSADGSLVAFKSLEALVSQKWKQKASTRRFLFRPEFLANDSQPNLRFKHKKRRHSLIFNMPRDTQSPLHFLSFTWSPRAQSLLATPLPKRRKSLPNAQQV